MLGGDGLSTLLSVSTLPRLKPTNSFFPLSSLPGSGCRAPPPWLIARGGNAFSILSRRLRRRVPLHLRSLVAPPVSSWCRTSTLRVLRLYGPQTFQTGLPLPGTTRGSTSSRVAASDRCHAARYKKTLPAVCAGPRRLGRGRGSTVARRPAARRSSRAPSTRALRANSRRRAPAFPTSLLHLSSPRQLLRLVLSRRRLSPAPRPALLRLRLDAPRCPGRTALAPPPAGLAEAGRFRRI